MPPNTSTTGSQSGRRPARHKAPGSLKRARVRAMLLACTAPRSVAVASAAGGLLAASAVVGGAMLEPDVDPAAATSDQAGSSDPASVPVTLTYDRSTDAVTRSGERAQLLVENPSVADPSLAELKTQALEDDAGGQARHDGRTVVRSDMLATSDADPQDIALAMLPDYGWSESEFGCLVELWTRESGWDPYADNPTSSAYGIPQSLPGEKMATAGPDWATNPATQIEWGLGYIRDSYGTPCAANSFQLGNNWY